jgi:hypothetical protein
MCHTLAADRERGAKEVSASAENAGS